MPINPYRSSLNSSVKSVQHLRQSYKDPAHGEGLENSTASKELLDEYHRTQWDLRAISYAIAACLSTDINFSMLVTFFPQEAKKRGLSSSTIGIIFAMFPVLMFSVSFFVPTLTARIGGTRTLKIAILVQAIATACMCFTSLIHTAGPFVGLCVAIRSVQGVCAAMTEVAATGLVMRSVPRENVGDAASLLEGSRTLGIIFGPTLGAGFYAALGYNGPFIFSAIVFGVIFVLMNAFAVDTSHESCDSEEEVKKKQTMMFKLLARPGVLLFAFVILLASSAITFIDPNLQPFLSKPPFNMQPWVVGLIYATIFVWFVVFMGIAPTLKKSVSDGTLVNVGFVILAAGYFIMAPPKHVSDPLSLFGFLHQDSKGGALGLLLTGFFLVGSGLGMAFNSFISLLTAEAEYAGFAVEEGSDALGSIISAFFSGGAALGPMLGGVLAHAFGFPKSTAFFGYICIANVILVYGGVTILYRNRDVSQSTDSNDAAAPLLESAETVV